jgi:hypothetical protein
MAEESTFVGQITLPSGTVAKLSASGWQCENEELAAYLNMSFGADKYSPSHGHWGVYLIQQAAGDLNAKAEVVTREPATVDAELPDYTVAMMTDQAVQGDKNVEPSLPA